MPTDKDELLRHLFNIETLLPSLENGDLILTANRRVAAKALAAYADHQTRLGLKAWPTARIYPFEGWIQQRWQELQDLDPRQSSAILLDSRQELLVWEQIIVNDEHSSALLKPAGAALQCQSGYKTLKLWQQSVDTEAYRQWQASPDPFAGWVRAFEQHCESRHWLVQAQAVEQLVNAYSAGRLPRENAVVPVAFQDQPPLYQQLLEAAADRVAPLPAPSINRISGSIQCSTEEEEIQQAAQWARQVLLDDDSACVGIIVPDLNNLRTAVEYRFRQVFDPHYGDPRTDAREAPFNMSIGTALADTAIIFNALELLSLKIAPLSLKRLQQLLYSPFLRGRDQELEGRVALEQQLRRQGKTDFKLSELCYWTEQLSPAKAGSRRPGANEDPVSTPVQPSLFGPAQTETSPQPGCPQLLAALTTLKSRSYPGAARAGSWAQWFCQLLTDIGWPGERRCNSLEYQQIDQWYELLRKLSRYDDLLGELSLVEAIRVLRKETQAAIFQAKTAESAVQVLGPLEAAGLQFSHLWLMGLSDDRWPAPPNPNPMLPVAFQRQLQMPHASPERQLEFARQLTESYLGSAEIAIFSHPARREDQQLRPSTLIAGQQEFDLRSLPVSGASCYRAEHELTLPARLQLASATLQTLDTSTAPPVCAAELQSIRGGSSLLKNQALCPFMAFAVHRLNARPLEQPSLGLSAAERGNLLHLALELFWKQARSLNVLRSYSQAQRDELLERVSHRALKPLQQRAAPWMGPRFWKIEQARLIKLLQRWLAVELQRAEFSVLALEQTLNTELAGLPLTLRIDRIDQLEDGSVLLIDYKTGASNPSRWAGERPREPQLPLYAIASRKPVAAISFAEINAQTTAFKGICADDDRPSAPAPGIKPPSQHRLELPADWEQVLLHWHATLERLVRQFLNGATMVDPVDSAAYDYSGLEPLNRIYEFEHLAEQESNVSEQ